MANKDYNSIFIDNVLFLLKYKKISKKSLCQKSGISISYFSGTLLNKMTKGNPSLEVMSKIASAFEVPLQLMLEEDLILSVDLQYINCFLDKTKADIVLDWAKKHIV